MTCLPVGAHAAPPKRDAELLGRRRSNHQSQPSAVRDRYRRNDLVKHDQSTTVGTITEAGLQSVTGDSARILVSVSVKRTTAVSPAPRQNSFRMRIDVKTGRRWGEGVQRGIHIVKTLVP